MDIDQLKALAERLKSLLIAQGHPIKHGQSLELIATIPGLRSWGEVMSFPDRVASAALNEQSVSRLCSRLLDKRAINIPASVLLEEMRLAVHSEEEPDLDVWPGGPMPGIYVTTQHDSVLKVLETFARNAPGALMFCEDAGSETDFAIALGEGGVFSPGLKRAPTGTLVVLGPLDLTEESWDDIGQRLRRAANLVYEAGHRVVALINTPSEVTLHFDVSRLIRWEDSPTEYVDESLQGIVAGNGDLVRVNPFVNGYPKPRAAQLKPAMEVPEQLLKPLREAIGYRRTGIIAVSSGIHRNRYQFLEAVLPHVARGEPVARIQPDFRGGYGGEPPLSDSFDGFAICPSIDAAYSQGYRIMIIEKAFGQDLLERMVSYAEEVCFLFAGIGPVETLFAHTLTVGSQHVKAAIASTIAILCVADIDTADSRNTVYDAYITHPDLPEPGSSDLDAYEYASSHRVIRWDDQLRELLATGAVTIKEAANQLRGYGVQSWKEYGRSRHPESQAG